MTVLCALPGLDGTARMLRGFVDAARAAGFADAYAVAYPPDSALDYDALEPLVREGLPTSPFVLLGESFSGPLALRIAADPPAQLRGLVLSTTFAVAPIPLPSACAPLAHLAPVHGAPAFALVWALLGRWRTPALEADLRACLRGVAPDVLRTRMAATLRVDARDALARIRVPTLVLRARHDRLMRAATSRRLIAGIPQADSIDIDGPHLLLQTRTDACIARILAFAQTRCAMRPA